ncbi:MAG: hypothetical protein JKY95_18940 [Planctomycetaceae bacterium]|nr:hypothetical protein [Planctomycetaceae bacterium]
MDLQAADSDRSNSRVGDSSQGDQGLLRPLRLLALGANVPDWEFLSQRLSRQQWELKEVSWNSDLFQTLQSLRSQHWDCLVISLCDSDEQYSHRELAAFLSAIRESGMSISILGLASSLDVELVEMFQEYQCDFHEIHSGWFSPVIGVLVNRTMQLQAISQAHQKLQSIEQQRQSREQEEAEVILAQQRNLLQQILKEQSKSDQSASSTALENASSGFDAIIVSQYEQTLRSFVVMGSGRLENELSQLVNGMQSRGKTPHDLLAMHLNCVQNIVEGLSHRSSRHVLQRSDQMLLDIMVHLAEIYRSDAA